MSKDNEMCKEFEFLLELAIFSVLMGSFIILSIIDVFVICLSQFIKHPKLEACRKYIEWQIFRVVQ